MVGGKEVPGSNGDIGAYVAKVLPGGAAEQTGKILEGMPLYQFKLHLVQKHVVLDFTKNSSVYRKLTKYFEDCFKCLFTV